MKLDAPNRYKMNKRNWNRLSGIAHQVFNETYREMLHNQVFICHTDKPYFNKKAWEVVSWNAAWTAANAVKI